MSLVTEDELRREKARLALDLVNCQDRCDLLEERLKQANDRIASYDSETLQLSKQLAADNAQLRTWIDKIRHAHAPATCADTECDLCEVLYPRLEVARGTHE